MAIDISDALLADGNPATEHSLVSGLAVQPGPIQVTEIHTDETRPLAATIIADDESSVFPGTPMGAPTGTGTPADPFEWGFTWEFIPDLGCDAVLRIESIVPGEIGTTVNVALDILTSFEEDPGLEIIQVGGGVLAGPP
jgi:hypothetical protein